MLAWGVAAVVIAVRAVSLGAAPKVEELAGGTRLKLSLKLGDTRGRGG